MQVVVNVLETMLKDVKVPPYEQPPLSQTYSTASTSESGTHSSSITETQQNPFSYKSKNMGNTFDALNEGQVTLPLTSSSIFSNYSRWSNHTSCIFWNTKHTRCFKFSMWARQWILRPAALVHPSKKMEHQRLVLITLPQIQEKPSRI